MAGQGLEWSLVSQRSDEGAFVFLGNLFFNGTRDGRYATRRFGRCQPRGTQFVTVRILHACPWGRFPSPHAPNHLRGSRKTSDPTTERAHLSTLVGESPGVPH